MVKKKSIVLLLPIIGYMIMLAHDVIPHFHHHHNGESREIDHSERKHDIPHHEHERNGNHNHNAILFLDHDMVLRFSQERQNIPETRIRDKNTPQINYTGLISNYSPIEYLPVLCSDASIPLAAAAYVHFQQVSCRLRAPPSV